jgi:hypothetical protein
LAQKEFDKAKQVKVLIDRTPPSEPAPAAQMPEDFEAPVEEIPPPPAPEDAAQKLMASREARKNYTISEQNDLINENLDGKARNFDKLNLKGTHYEQLTESSLDDFL